MIFFILPNVHYSTYKHIEYIHSESESGHMVSSSLAHYLYEIKEKISTREKEWDIFKKYTNTYEYIHTIIPFRNKSVSKYKPLSRSFFKMIEVITTFDLFSNFERKKSNTYEKIHGREADEEQTSQKRDHQRRTKFDFDGGNRTNNSENVPFSPLHNVITSDNKIRRGFGKLCDLTKIKNKRHDVDNVERFSGCETGGDRTNMDEESVRKRGYSQKNMIENLEHESYIPTISNGATHINTFHLAEGPGGFIEAVCHLRNNPKDVYHGMTILDDSDDGIIPGWKKSDAFLMAHPNVHIETGKDGTGNILSLENFEHSYQLYGSSMDFITGDGGFDFSHDFNKQEVNVAHLLFAQVAYALCLQKKGGHFVLKIFDSFHYHTVDILYILSSFYRNVYITKPLTSRIGNSEKYIVCKDFIFENANSFYPYLYNSFSNMLRDLSTRFIYRFLNISIPKYFMNKIEESNSIFGQQQIENIHYTISLIDKNMKNDKMEVMIKNNITKCVNWCIKYNISYNNIW